MMKRLLLTKLVYCANLIELVQVLNFEIKIEITKNKIKAICFRFSAGNNF